MPYQFNKRDEIEGLDVPMWNPELIPPNHVQSFDDRTKTWKVRKENRNSYLDQFPVIHWGDHPDILP